ncbi:MAG: transposase, partial [Fimbriimonadales bacterium]
VKAVAVGYWQGGRVWLVGVALGPAYADEGKLLGAWVQAYGCGGLPWGTLLVGDALYGYRARLLCALERAGWLPVARVSDGVWQRVRASSRLRARVRAALYPEVVRGRYRIEQVFGSVKDGYGSYVGARSWQGARSWVWGMWVLWNLVGVVQVSGERGVLCIFVWLRRFFEHPRKGLTSAHRMGYK